MREKERKGRVSPAAQRSQAKPQKKLPKKRISPIVIFAFFGALFYAGINIASSKMELNKKQAEYAEKEYLYAQLTAENESLKKIKETGDIDEYVIKIAREKLNLVFPDDKVYKIIE